MNILFSKIETA